MKKKRRKQQFSPRELKKLFCIMKLVFFFLLLSSNFVWAGQTYAQTKSLSLELNNVELEEVFNAIRRQSEFEFFYNNDQVNTSVKVSVKVKNADIKTVLEQALPAIYEYKINDRYILINKRKDMEPVQSPQPQQQAKKRISGQVTDKNGESIIGANIIEKGTANGTITDIDGNFSLMVADNAVIQISYIGYKTQSVQVNNRSVINVTMEEEAQEFDDVVVVGYGVQKKVSLTGAISNISTKDILTTKSPSLAVALAGKVPGLQIRQNNGLPGSFNTMINVRGMGTPLFVIDGVVRDEPTEFQKLNPEDIESVTVLKDASAAIYGINSSNGVILVKTKSGSAGPLRISYNGLAGFTTPTTHTNMMNVAQYWDVRNENSYFSNGAPYFSSRDELQTAQALPYVNWYDATFKKSAFQQQHNLILEGGNEVLSNYFSLGYNTDNGLLRSGDIGYHKYSLRNSSNVKVNKYFTIDVNLSGYVDLRKQPGTWDDAFYYLNKSAHGLIPSETIYANNDPNYYNRPQPLSDNPVQFSQREQAGYGEWRDRFFQSSLAMTYNVPYVKGLKLKVQGAFDYKNYIRTRVQKRPVNYIYSASSDTYKSFTSYDPSIQEESTSLSRGNLQGHIIYNTKIMDAHNVGVVLVGEAREDNSRYLSGKRFYEGDFFTIDNIDRAPTTNQQAGGNTSSSTYMSFIGRINYDFKSKYLLEFAFREDGSYRYAPGQRWGFFPVVSGGWRVAEEGFVKNNFPMISNLKIRGSYGLTGQNAGNPFQFVPGYSSYNGYVLSSNGKYVSGYTNAGLLNDKLTWTESKTADIGADVGLWNGKLDFSFDLYRRNRSGLLATRLQALPNTFGATLPQENLNSDRTEGFELMISHTNKVNGFEYGVSGNMNIGRSKVIYAERAPFRSSWDRWRNGSVNRWQDLGWGYQAIGQYQDYNQIRDGVIETGAHANSRTLPGDYIHLDVDGDGKITDKDRMPIFWNGQPKLNFGLTFYASWKGFDFNMLWQGAGMYSLKYGEILGQVLALDYSNSPEMYYDRWHLANLYDPNSAWIPGKFPATRRLDSDNGANRLESDIQRVDATYARLKNIELGYTIPSKHLKKLGINKMRWYVNGFNLLVFCNSYLKSFDPEITDGNGFQYPLTKSYNLGVNFTF